MSSLHSRKNRLGLEATGDEGPLEPSKQFTEKHKDYPERFPVPTGLRAWGTPFPGYEPPYPKFENLAGASWREPELSSLADAPKNPFGRTGIAGRGILGKWGANHAADPIITRYDQASGELLVMLIQRADSGQWAIPGGMVDPGEKVSATAGRELLEETGVAVDMSDATEIYQGFVDDPRNTDNAWMETSVFHKHLDDRASALIGGKRLASFEAGETSGIEWVSSKDTRLENLYASHAGFVKAALKGIEGP